jgi:hypothetical protein
MGDIVKTQSKLFAKKGESHEKHSEPSRGRLKERDGISGEVPGTV